jgi:hypothetical protein
MSGDWGGRKGGIHLASGTGRIIAMTDEQRRRGGVFFDADGTLPGTNYLHVAAWREAFTMSSRLSPARTSSSGR